MKVGVINSTDECTREESLKRWQKEKYGLDVELVRFSGSLLPNNATNHGELDANVFQHRPFLEQDNQAHGYKLVAVGNTLSSYGGSFQKNQNRGVTIKRRRDSGNPTTRPTFVAHLSSEKEKLITLKEEKGSVTALDITDNPRHLQIMELEGHSSRAYW
ncbi:MetQ/NlpA family ABC transporter substrate-binding protein [Escherichia coli]